MSFLQTVVRLYISRVALVGRKLRPREEKKNGQNTLTKLSWSGLFLWKWLMAAQKAFPKFNLRLGLAPRL